jgi:2-dehydropantoate 2-reductase
MKIAIMGSGGVGGYFGARLATGGADVHFVARGPHLDAMRTQGLTIEGGAAPLQLLPVQATDDPLSIGTATTIDRPGVIRQTGPMQRLLFGELDGTTSDRGRFFLDACLNGGIAAELSSDIQREIWQKYVFLVGLSGTTTTMRRPIGPIRETPKRAPSCAMSCGKSLPWRMARE